MPMRVSALPPVIQRQTADGARGDSGGGGVAASTVYAGLGGGWSRDGVDSNAAGRARAAASARCRIRTRAQRLAWRLREAPIASIAPSALRDIARLGSRAHSDAAIRSDRGPLRRLERSASRLRCDGVVRRRRTQPADASPQSTRPASVGAVAASRTPRCASTRASLASIDVEPRENLDNASPGAGAREPIAGPDATGGCPCPYTGGGGARSTPVSTSRGLARRAPRCRRRSRRARPRPQPPRPSRRGSLPRKVPPPPR